MSILHKSFPELSEGRPGSGEEKRVFCSFSREQAATFIEDSFRHIASSDPENKMALAIVLGFERLGLPGADQVFSHDFENIGKADYTQAVANTSWQDWFWASTQFLAQVRDVAQEFQVPEKTITDSVRSLAKHYLTLHPEYQAYLAPEDRGLYARPKRTGAVLGRKRAHVPQAHA